MIPQLSPMVRVGAVRCADTLLVRSPGADGNLLLFLFLFSTDVPKFGAPGSFCSSEGRLIKAGTVFLVVPFFVTRFLSGLSGRASPTPEIKLVIRFCAFLAFLLRSYHVRTYLLYLEVKLTF